MKKKMFLVVTALLLSMALIVTGCGGSKSGDGKVYKVATDATYAPMEYMDESGKIVGLDIDIINEVAKAAGIKLDIINYGWEPLFDAVKNGEVDFAISSITITDERKQTYDFTDPYFYANQLILAPEGSSVKGAADLTDKKIAVQIGTTGHEAVKGIVGETNPNIMAYESMPLAITAMLNGDTDVAVGDNSVVNGYIKNNPNVKVVTIDDPSFEREYYGLMTKKGNTELLKILNDGIKKIKDNGKLKELSGLDLQ